MTYINGSEKSSRSKADYFEVLIADKLAKHYKVGKNFQREVADLEKEVALACVDSENRIIEQKERAKNTSGKLIDFLVGEGITRIKDVEWIGRYHQTKHTLSDVDLILDNNEKIGISLKSVGSGLGTQKNLGYRSLKSYLSLDIDKDLEQMWDNIRRELGKSGDNKIRALAGAPKSIIKSSKRKHPIISEIGREYGFLVQANSVNQSVKNFNKLTDSGKSAFLKLIFGAESGRKLLNVIAQPEKITIHWNSIPDYVASGAGLEARKIKDISYGIYVGDGLIVRIQASFTNGIGISAYCQRAFLTGIDDN